MWQFLDFTTLKQIFNHEPKPVFVVLRVLRASVSCAILTPAEHGTCDCDARSPLQKRHQDRPFSCKPDQCSQRALTKTNCNVRVLHLPVAFSTFLQVPLLQEIDNADIPTHTVKCNAAAHRPCRTSAIHDGLQRPSQSLQKLL